jgi:Flp pilus assembly protein TadG
MWAVAKLARWLSLFERDSRGGLAVNFALVLLPLCMITCGAVDFASVYSDKQRMQQVADSAALDAAAQLLLADTSGVPDRTNAFALSQLGRIADRVSLSANTVISAKGDSVTVTIDGQRPSFFANLLPPGGFHLRTAATAMSMGRTPLCVLDTGSAAAAAMSMKDSAYVTAPGCLVHSDSDIGVTGSAWLQADAVQAVGAASGRISPAPLVGAAQIPDPFAAMTIAPPSGLLTCVLVPDLLTNVVQLYMAKGKHCGSIVVGANRVLNMAPGDHYFTNGQLILQQGATLKGKDVALIFDSNSNLIFKDNSQIQLEGRKSGKYAGFVIATTSANTKTFEISSDHAHELLGTIYMPNATLLVSGAGARVADQSAWTVIVAKTLQLKGSPDLVINHNYDLGGVPIPDGVGKSRGVVLVH